MRTIMVVALLISAQWVMGQKYFSKTGKISFYSDAAMEKIEAHNTSASTVLDISTGAFEWAVLIRGFAFDKALMQEHFNENYMESATYPKAKFKGKIDNPGSVNFFKDGEYTVSVSGQMEIHGVTRPVTIPGTITVKGGVVSARSRFTVLPEDYKIEIPKVVADNIAKKIDVTVQADYQALNAVP